MLSIVPRTRYISIAAVLSLALMSAIKAEAATTAVVSSPFLYNFNTDGVLVESRTIENSTSPYFWLTSGTNLIIEEGLGKTVQGPLATGTYPQNNFTLITRSEWNNTSQEISFKLNNVNTVNTPNRDAYSGFFLLSRHKDMNNFYQTGVRMDGLAVVKKKIGGIYYTLGKAQVFGSQAAYNRNKNPNLIPTGVWMRMRSETKDMPNGDVSITLWVDKDASGIWTEVLTVTDKTGVYGNSPTLKNRAYAGIHSDYMDLSFDDYKLTEL